jgi:hypothetical protein
MAYHVRHFHHRVVFSEPSMPAASRIFREKFGYNPLGFRGSSGQEPVSNCPISTDMGHTVRGSWAPTCATRESPIDFTKASQWY